MQLTLNNISKSFDSKPVLRNITLEIQAGEVVVLLGPSGCGKTTLLRIIAGLEQPDVGEILLEGKDLSFLPVYKRGFGMVFQEYALFPHKNVFDNVAFGLRMKRWKPSQTREQVQRVLELVGLTGMEQRPIFELSGGEQQRVALARSLAPAPTLLLLDEPLGALDRALREQLMLELRTILKTAGAYLGEKEGVSSIYVTHDQVEAFAIADRIVVINEGQIEQEGGPYDLFHHPRTPFVARFLGLTNILEGEIISLVPPKIRTDWGDFEIPGRIERKFLGSGSSAFLLIRPEAGDLFVDKGEQNSGEIYGTLVSVSFRGRYQIATVADPDIQEPLQFEFSADESLPSPGSRIRVAINPQQTQLLTKG